MRSRHISVIVRRRVDEVYDFVSEPHHLLSWAPGLVAVTRINDDELGTDSLQRDGRVRLADRNSLGVLDYEVVLPDGATVYYPLRVVAHPHGAEVVVTMRQSTDDEEAFEREAARVAAGLDDLRRRLDGISSPPRATRPLEQPVEMRIAGPADADSVAQLLHDFNSEFDCPGPDPSVGAQRFEQLLAREDVLAVVARDGAENGRPDIGFALVTLRPTPYWDGPLAHLEELYVRPAYRSLGVGTRILTLALDDVRSRGSAELHINVDADDTDARRFYRRHGFTDTDPDTGSGMRLYLRQL